MLKKQRVTRKATDEIEKASFKDGVEYELFYWNDDWVKIDSKIAVADKPLHFDNVPDNALLWLGEKDSRKEERILLLWMVR